MKIFGRTTTHNFIKIKIITIDYTYYMIVQSILRYEYFMTLILRKTQVRCIKNSRLNELFVFFIIFSRITTYNFVQINTITLNYALL
jgi:hypothetical protein